MPDGSPAGLPVSLGAESAFYTIEAARKAGAPALNDGGRGKSKAGGQRMSIMARLSNGIAGSRPPAAASASRARGFVLAAALAASVALGVTPALAQQHGFHGGDHGFHGGDRGPAMHGFAAPHARYAVPQHWAGMHPRWEGGPRAGYYVRPWGPHWVPHGWGGGYWHGGYWPHVRLGWDFPWFLATLPVGCVTYYWGAVPYYYWQGVYYAWSPDYAQYVVTDPPPVSGGVAEGAAPPPAAAQPGANPGQGAMSLFVYPKNGQSEQQTSNDRYQCHEWAVGQTGFDPTNTANETQATTATPENYKRAMTACLEARGYSVR